MTAQTKQTAAETAQMRLFKINRMLDRLTRHNTKQERNFNADKIDWADVGSLVHIEAKLQEISNFVFQEGEYAE